MVNGVTAIVELAQALGVQLHGGDAFDVDFGAVALLLLRLAYMDFAGLDPRVGEAPFQIATDVSSPLCGPNGAAIVYAPQKGGRPEQLPWPEATLANLADTIEKDLGLDVRDLPGRGAAGLLGVLDPTRKGQGWTAKRWQARRPLRQRTGPQAQEVRIVSGSWEPGERL